MITLLTKRKLKVPQATKKGFIECPIGGVFDWSYPTSKLRRGRVQGDGTISPTLLANSCGTNILVYEGFEKEDSL